MDVIAAYRQVGSYRDAAAMCGTTHKTVRRIVAAQLAGEQPPGRLRVATTTTRAPSLSRPDSHDPRPAGTRSSRAN